MRNKSYPILWESPFNVELEGIAYFFSTRIHLERFLRTYPKNREAVEAQLTKRYKVLAKNDRLADLHSYVSCETRGFYIIDTVNGGEYKWQGEALLNGAMLTPSNLESSFPNLTQSLPESPSAIQQ